MAVLRRVLLAAVTVPGAAVASEEAVLEVDGAIAPPAPRRLTLSQIEALGRVDLVTHTPWTIGPQNFAGLPMERLLEAVEARGETLRALALNDYAVSMPIAEIVAAGAFLATQLDGAPIPVRLRGPFWIIFPWSQRPDLGDAIYRRRSVWQVQRIDIT
jgi:hypothetical protein